MSSRQSCIWDGVGGGGTKKKASREISNMGQFMQKESAKLGKESFLSGRVEKKSVGLNED